MSTSLIILIPAILLGIVGTLCFVGCILPKYGLGPSFNEYTPKTILLNSKCIAYWPLKEIADTVPAAELISGNTGSGVFLSGSSTVGTLVMGNYIGADVTGSLVLSNGGYGVSIVGAMGNTVGGTTAGAGNLISGNSRAGVDLHGAGAANGRPPCLCACV